jgi:hypothetical protein
MRSIALMIGMVFGLASVGTSPATRPRQAPAQEQAPAQPANPPPPAPIAAHDKHEGLDISAVPLLDGVRSKEIFGKQDPYSAGILALEVSLQNLTTDAMRVTGGTIRLEVDVAGEERQKLQPLRPREVATLIAYPAGAPNVTSRRFPTGVQVPTKDKKVDKITEQIRPFALDVDVIPPMAKLHGYLFFNIAKEFDVVRDSTLYLPDIKIVAGNKPLMFFEVPLASAAH